MFDGSHCRDEELGFPDFLKDNRETNCCVPLQIYYTILHCSSGMVATCPIFPKILATIFFRSANNFCWIRLILKHPYSRLLFTFGLIRVNPRFITCHDVIDVFRSTAIVFFNISLDQSSLFL